MARDGPAHGRSRTEWAGMKRWWKLGPLAVAAGLALLGSSGLVFSEGEQGVVNATVKVNPLGVSLTVPSSPVAVGEEFTVLATVENQGESRIRRLTLDLQLPTAALEVHGRTIHRLGSLRPFGSRNTEWELTAVQSGSFVLMVTAEGFDSSDGVAVSAESGAKVIAVDSPDDDERESPENDEH